jgi:hypothetical protein
MIQNIMMKPVHNIIQRYHRWLGTHLIPPTKPENKATSKVKYTKQGLPD